MTTMSAEDIRSRVYGAGPENDNLYILSSAEFIKGFVPPDYLIVGILQRRFIYSFTGRTGSGKTAVGLLIAALVAIGNGLGKHVVKKGRVLYLAGENPDDARMRWLAMAEQMGFDINTIEVWFRPGVFKISELSDRVAEEVTKIGGVSLVIVDTGPAFFEGNEENSNVQLGGHARRLREILTTLPGGPAVLVNCHPTKNADDDNLVPRGGGAFLAEVDGNLTCWKENETVEVHWQGKFRGPEFAPLSFRLRTLTCGALRDSEGRSIPTVVASHLSESGLEEIAARNRHNEDKLLTVIAANPGCSLAKLATLARWITKDGAPYKMLAKRIVDSLERQKLVINDKRDGIQITEKGRKCIKS